MRGWGSTTDRILILLEDKELTKLQICSALNLTHDNVSAVLTRLRRESKKFGKRIYICGYTRAAQGKRYYLRAIFKAGSRPDKEKPPAISQRDRSMKYHRKQMAIKRSDIFRRAA